jgi:glycosyltransferase involved in cell wall biosynthesis
MRILIHSNGPMEPTGYGLQVRQLLPRLKQLGHTPIVSAFSGLHGGAINWDGTTILPSGQLAFGLDMVIPHARTSSADLTLFLCDFREMAPIAGDLATMRTAAWLPLDTYPISKPEEYVIRTSRTRPIAMSRFGMAQLQEAGYTEALYVPHAIDTSVYRPPKDRAELRAEVNWTERFVIGICAANSDMLRKGWPEQFAAFAQFRKQHPEALLAVHTIPFSQRGLDLPELARAMGIDDAITFSDPYAQLAGNFTPASMAKWFGALDVLSCCSYGEGFGVPIIEAQACGTPVICTNGSAMTELNPLGFAVEGTRFWNHVHEAWWTRPDIDAIEAGYEHFLKTPADSAERASLRRFAERYDSRHVAETYWKPALEAMAAE